MAGLKKFLSNKNTVTIICVILGIVVLYIGYQKRIEDQINPITVPYARTTINPGTLITDEMVGTIEVPPAMLQGKPYTDRNLIIGKYTQSNSVIPIGSLFYENSIVEKAQVIESSIIGNYPKGYELYSLNVNMNSTYGNSILPGNYIDIYLKAINKEGTNSKDNDKIMVGKLLQNVKVLAVHDSSGKNVFENIDELSTPSQIIFALPHDYWVLLSKASYLGSYNTDIVPVPTDAGSKGEVEEVSIANETLVKWINNVTEWTEDIG